MQNGGIGMTQNEGTWRFWAGGFALFFMILILVGLGMWDVPVAEAVRTGVGKGFKNVARFFSRYGDFPFLLGGGVIALGIALWKKRHRGAKILVAMILASILAGLTANVIKLGSGRVRPRVESVEQGWYGTRSNGKWVSLDHDFQSFPSSHAACAFGFFFPLFFYRRWDGALGLTAAALVSASRVQLNAHHISDVAAGAFLGLVAAWLVWRWIIERGVLSRWIKDSN